MGTEALEHAESYRWSQAQPVRAMVQHSRVRVNCVPHLRAVLRGNGAVRPNAQAVARACISQSRYDFPTVLGPYFHHWIDWRIFR